MLVRRMLRSKVQFCIVDYAIGVVRDMISNPARRAMASDHRDSKMLHDVNIQSLGYG